MTDLKRVNIYVTEDQWRRFAALHLEDGRSASEHIREALDVYIQRKYPPSPTLRTVQITPNPPLMDKDGYLHGRITGVYGHELVYDDHDMQGLEWVFTAPGARREVSRSLFTATLYAYHPMPGITYIGDTNPRPNDLARLILACGLLTEEDFLEQSSCLRLKGFDTDSLIGIHVRYKLTTVRNRWVPPPEGYDPEWEDQADPAWYELQEGVDIETVTLDPDHPSDTHEDR